MNTALRGLLDEAEMSYIALGRAIVAAGAREGIHLATNTTSVRRMLQRPAHQLPHPPHPQTTRQQLALTSKHPPSLSQADAGHLG